MFALFSQSEASGFLFFWFLAGLENFARLLHCYIHEIHCVVCDFLRGREVPVTSDGFD